MNDMSFLFFLSKLRSCGIVGHFVIASTVRTFEVVVAIAFDRLLIVC